jgi:D-glycero-D-manno-heptose 1,7-bisphosphate phosphatase
MDNKPNCAVFIDRDGTLSEEVGYVDHPDHFHLLPRSAEAIRRINQSGLKAVVITNQSGVARRYFPESRVHEIHAKLKDLLANEGAYLDAIYYCPHHPDEKCTCRKPAPGMLEVAADEHGINLAHSFVVGDKMSDVYTAHRVGAKGILVLTGYGQEEYDSHKQEWPEQPDYVAQDLYAAVEWILAPH